MLGPARGGAGWLPANYPECSAAAGGHAMFAAKMAQRGGAPGSGGARAPGTPQPPSAFLEQLRQYHESDKQWTARRHFIERHLPRYERPGTRLDQLLALSMVWSNHVFMGCRYGSALMEKVSSMAEGIDIGEMPSYELVPGAQSVKRTSSAVAGQEPPKKQTTSKFRPRPRFEPVHFVASTIAEDVEKAFKVDEDSRTLIPNSFNGSEALNSMPEHRDTDFDFNRFSQHEENSQMDEPTPTDLLVYDVSTSDDLQSKSVNDTGNFMTKMEQNYSAKFESHNSTLSKNFRTHVLDMWAENSKQSRKGIGFVKPPNPKRTGRVSSNRKGPKKNVTSDPYALTLERQTLIRKLCAVVAKNLNNPTIGGAPAKINNTYMLTRCIQACKTNPEYIYVSLKQISPADLPKNKRLPPDGYACEVRCQNMYLATGYSGSKNGARDRAAEQAMRLLQRPVEVKTVQRKFRHGFQDDLIVCPCGLPTPELPPPLKEQDYDKSGREDSANGQEDAYQSKEPRSTKPWTSFVLTENASDAVCILNNSASFNKMKLEYKYDLMPSLAWRCRLFLQDHCVAEGYGNKKTSKHAAAEEAVNILKKMQSNVRKISSQGPIASGDGMIMQKQKTLKDLVVYENSSNPVCTLNDTAQFNKVAVEYIFETMAGEHCKCKVLLDHQFITEVVGLRKNVKQAAAEEALRILKQTQPTVINSLRKGPVDEAISRSEICGRSAQEAYKQKIKDDNIGNQLLRKMGWTGGGLGKEGEGIAEPITVKEQFKREGLGLDADKNSKVNKRDIEQMIRNYAASYSQENLTFSNELSNEERKQIHLVAKRFGLKSKSHGKGASRFLVVSRKRRREDLIDELKQVGQVAGYELVMPQSNQF